MRRILTVTAIINVVAIALAAISGTLPPRLLDFALPQLTGEPFIRLDGDDVLLGVLRNFFGHDLSISNSLFTMWIVMAMLIGVALVLTRDLREQPTSGQNVVELLVQGFRDFVEGVGGPGALRFVPLFGTLFLFILVSNYLGQVPFVGQQLNLPGIGEAEPLRAPTSDYHVNLGLAVTSFVVYQLVGIRRHGIGYFSRFVNLSGFRPMPQGLFMGPILLFVGILELFSELFRMLTLTLRLWGNILGGEISLAVMASLLVIPALAFPFIGLELLVGLVQSLIFSTLVLVYVILALESHEEEHAEEHKEVAHA